MSAHHAGRVGWERDGTRYVCCSCGMSAPTWAGIVHGLARAVGGRLVACPTAAALPCVDEDGLPEPDPRAVVSGLGTLFLDLVREREGDPAALAAEAGRAGGAS